MSICVAVQTRKVPLRILMEGISFSLGLAETMTHTCHFAGRIGIGQMREPARRDKICPCLDYWILYASNTQQILA